MWAGSKMSHMLNRLNKVLYIIKSKINAWHIHGIALGCVTSPCLCKAMFVSMQQCPLFTFTNFCVGHTLCLHRVIIIIMYK